MGILLFLCVISMVEVTCTTATGTADARSIPGGYVVPERGNVTFTCSSSSGRNLLWNVTVATLGDPVSYDRVEIRTASLKAFPGFSIPDESSTTNPARFTFHNISMTNNPSPVKCSDPSTEEESTAVIIVEGSPNCPTPNILTNPTSLAVSIQKSRLTWLPEWYCVKAVSYNGSIASIVGNSSLNGSASFEVTSLEPDTVYNITVIPCNMVGCNESCDVHSVQTKSGEGTRLEVPTEHDVTSDSVSIQPLILIGVAILVSMVLVILVVIALASAGLLIRRKRGKWTLAKGTAEQRRGKPQSTQQEYAETAMDHNGTNSTEYAVVAHSNTSAKGPPRQANTTCATGPGNSPLEYATVQDALHVRENVPQGHPSLTNTPSLSSPPAPPCSPSGVGISPDCVQDAGYSSLPDSRNGSNRITKVRSLRQK